MDITRASSVSFGQRIAAGWLAALLSIGARAGVGYAGDCNQNGAPDDADLLAGELTLQSSRSYPAGDEPWAIAAGDLDGDGDQDIVTANRAANDVSVLLNAGYGSFAEPTRFQVGDEPVGIAAADLDGDEDIDLATAHSGSFRVSLLFNDSTGAYAQRVSVDVDEVQTAIAAGDLDGDGDIDLVVGKDSPAFAVFWNDGTGRFERGDYETGAGGPLSVVVADFDRDGLSDIAASTWDRRFTLLFNEGSRRFTAPAHFGAEPEFGSLMAAGDLDGDSYLDLIDTGENSPYEGSLGALRNERDRTFGGYALYQAGYGTRGIAAGDLDGDGDADIVAANSNSSDLSVVLSEGPDTNADPRPRVPAGKGPRAVALADLNGDAHVDVAVANSASDDVSIFLVEEDGTLPSPGRFRASAIDGPESIGAEFAVTGDFDGDADIDILTFSGTQADLLLNQGNGTLDLSSSSFQDQGGDTAAAGDLDGDGDLDIAVATDERPIVILTNSGSGTFSQGKSFAAGADPVSPVLSDLDGDGALDIAAADRGEDAVSVLLNDGEGAFNSLRQFPAGPAPAWVAAADLDRDGKPDIACVNPGADQVRVLLNEGGGTFGAPVSHAVGDDPRSIAAGDLDGDGDIDLATANRGSDTVSVLLNTGAGAFGHAAGLKTARSPVSIALGDLDGDGDLEIAAGNSGSNTVSVFVNGGAATFKPGTQLLAGRNVSCVTLADLDGDGLEDLLSMYTVWNDDDASEDQLSVLWNDTVPPASRDRDGSGKPDECESKAVIRLAAEPTSVIIDGGARAVAFAGSLEAQSLEEDLVWEGAVFENVGPGDASVLTTGVRLYSDPNGNGTLDTGDEELGSAAFDPATQRVAYQGLSRPLARGAPESLLLVLDLEQPVAGVVPRDGISIPEPNRFLLGLCSIGVLAAVLSSMAGRSRRLAWAPVLLLLVSVVVPAGCGGDGGNGQRATSRTLFIRWTALETRGEVSGLPPAVEGLPLTAWSVDA